MLSVAFKYFPIRGISLLRLPATPIRSWVKHDPDIFDFSAVLLQERPQTLVAGVERQVADENVMILDPARIHSNDDLRVIFGFRIGLKTNRFTTSFLTKCKLLLRSTFQVLNVVTF